MQSTNLTDAELEEALAGCSNEPVHIPGTVQPFGCLISIDAKTQLIDYASVNVQDIIGLNPMNVLKDSADRLFDRDFLHALGNAAAKPDFHQASQVLGRFTINGHTVDCHAFGSGDQRVIELEPATDSDFGSDDAFATLEILIDTIQKCRSEQELFDHTTELLRHITGYDRIMVYKFDADYNGDIVAEMRKSSMESFKGLRFPNYDIPQQARDIMRRLPVRIIAGVDDIPMPLMSASPDLPPLDIAIAAVRGVSQVHMQYLRNMNVSATMTLSITLNDRLWGLISFHHTQNRYPSAGLRRVLNRFIGLFSTKLETLEKEAVLEQIRYVDQVKNSLMFEIDGADTTGAAFDEFSDIIMNVMRADGLTIILDDQYRSYGQTPDATVHDALFAAAKAEDNRTVTSQCLVQQFPDLANQFNDVAGALAYAIGARSAVIFYRKPVDQQVNWAGAPTKEVEDVAGLKRLKPRSSFSVYLQQVKDRCEAWSERDLFLASRIMPLINSEERRALLNTMNRQQALMINELNHRVRNILTLVRSISSQASRDADKDTAASPDLESRIQALAKAHDMATGSAVSSVSVVALIQAEMAPFEQSNQRRFSIAGLHPHIRADAAPIFSLVIHELATNAAKYGALSVQDGTVSIDISCADGGFIVTWTERKGPEVEKPNRQGFGTTLIEEAVPHELNGRTELVFDPDGVRAKIFLPDQLFEDLKLPAAPLEEATTDDDDRLSDPIGVLPQDVLDGTALILEDNYIIAKEMADQLRDFGFQDVVMLSNVEDALSFLDDETPAVAVFDVHLGDDETSIEAALRLIMLDVPFLFVTGYGETGTMPDGLAGVRILKKPVKPERLLHELGRTIQHRESQG